MAPVTAACNTRFRAARQSGTRPDSAVKWIVLHSTEGGTAESVARYFTSPQARGSAHLVVDDGECYRCLANNAVPWGAPGANEAGFHIEQCGFARWDAALWARHWRTIERAAYKTALHCVYFRIPPQFLTASELRRELRGVTTHAECTRAFGGDHTDPGRLWPRRSFMHRVQEFHAAMLAA